MHGVAFLITFHAKIRSFFDHIIFFLFTRLVAVTAVGSGVVDVLVAVRTTFNYLFFYIYFLIIKMR